MRQVFVTVALLACVAGALHSQVAQEPEAAVVRIWTDLGATKRGFGTGFFISPDGEVLTCYHVIQGARALTLFHGSKAYRRIIVDRIAPSLDLAVLRIEGLEAEVPFLKLAEGVPTGTGSLDVIGHPIGISNLRFRARQARSGFVRAIEFREPGTMERLFADENMDLIALDLTIYEGMSGGPVIGPTGVIGVVSGSLTQGGAVAWAIPRKYLRSPAFKVVRQRPQAITSWEPLTLMGNGWRSLRRSVIVDELLAQAVSAYFDGVDDLARAQNRLPPIAARAASKLSPAVMALRQATLADTDVANREAALLFLGRAQPQVDSVEEASHQMVAAYVTVFQKVLDVVGQLDKWPHTQRNDSISQVIVPVTEALEIQLRRPNDFLNALVDEDSAALEALSRATHVRDLLPLMVGLQQRLRQYASPEAMNHLADRIRLFREFGDTLQRFVQAEFDSWSTPWQFSNGGVAFTVAAGWERNLNPTISQPIRAQLATDGWTMLDALTFFGTGVRGRDLPEASLIVATRRHQPVTPEWMRAFTMAFMNGQPGGAVHQQEFAGVPAIVGRAVVVQHGQRRSFRSVIISHPNGDVLFMTDHAEASSRAPRHVFDMIQDVASTRAGRPRSP